jgi:hypothetical protein
MKGLSKLLAAVPLVRRQTPLKSQFKRPTTVSAGATILTPMPLKPWKMVWHMQKSTIPASGWCGWRRESKNRPKTMTFTR